MHRISKTVKFLRQNFVGIRTVNMGVGIFPSGHMPLSIGCATAPGYSPNFLLQLMFCSLIKTCKPRSSGLVENDHQRRLVMVDPSLPNGDPIPGFKDYAVNMIELAKMGSGILDIRSRSGLRLRERVDWQVL
ncbi:BnaC01g42620D [Brassica napus]|uniref:(rape) hypothetical protein n=1 Tax=Brassica napus TaxID=3708 RepID=A0A078IVN6_BRANA|nr:unnamed protein product [Brassica napus]CDY55605.1 BnaC01g42620D [Brassica napus]